MASGERPQGAGGRIFDPGGPFVVASGRSVPGGERAFKSGEPLVPVQGRSVPVRGRASRSGEPLVPVHGPPVPVSEPTLRSSESGRQGCRRSQRRYTGRSIRLDRALGSLRSVSGRCRLIRHSPLRPAPSCVEVDDPLTGLRHLLGAFPLIFL